MTTLAAAPKRAETVVEIALGAGMPPEAVGRLAEAIARASGAPESPELRSLALDAQAERHAILAGIVPNIWHGANERYTAALHKIQLDADDAEAAEFASAVESYTALRAQYEPLLARSRELAVERATKHSEGEHHLRQLGIYRNSPSALHARVATMGDGGATVSVFDLYCRQFRIEQRDRLRIYDAIEAFEAFAGVQGVADRELTAVSRQITDLEQRYPALARLREGASA